MARGVNRVTLIGNLGADPQVRQTTSGSSVANVSLATSDRWKNKQTGDVEERTEWHRVIFFNRLAEIVGQYLRKGSKIYVEGSIRTRKWTDQNNMERYTTEIIANEMQMLDSRAPDDAQMTNRYTNSAGTNSTPTNTGINQSAPVSNQAPAQQSVPSQPVQQAQQNQPQSAPIDDVPGYDDDDIPF